MKTRFLFFVVCLGWAGLTLLLINSSFAQESPEYSHISGSILNHEGMGEPNMPITVRATIDGREESLTLRTDDQGHFLFEVSRAEWQVFVEDDELLSRGYSRSPVYTVDSSVEEDFIFNIVPNRPFMDLRVTAGGDVVTATGSRHAIGVDSHPARANSGDRRRGGPTDRTTW